MTVELFPGFLVGPDDTFADVGCGLGDMTVAALRVGARAYAVDVTPGTVAVVAERLAPFGRGHVRLATSDTVPLEDGLATRIVCIEVLEHVADPAYFASELARIGQPGAEYVISVPDAVSEGVLKTVSPDWMWQAPHHVRVFERQQFHALVTGAGLEVTNTLYVGFYWSVWWALRFAAGSEHHPGRPDAPTVLQKWEEAWAALNATPEGRQGALNLDRGMPKSQVILARKP